MQAQLSEDEAGGSRVQGQSGLHSQMVSQINKPSAWNTVQLVKALPHEHEDPSHSPRIYKKLSESPCNPRDGEMGGGDRQIPGALWPASLADKVKFQANERSHLKKWKEPKG